MLDFMGMTKLVEDLGPRRHSTGPNHTGRTQVSTNHGYTNTCKHTYLPMDVYLARERSYAGQFSQWPLGSVTEHNTEGDEAGWRQG